MPLPIPNLDDKTFNELFEEARALIPRYAPEWTDHNLSDPGITFIDLFAWLAEMQIYFLNRVTDKNFSKFFKLLGEASIPAQPAKADVTFELSSPDEPSVTIPKGTPVSATDSVTAERIVFETDENVLVHSGTLRQVLTHAGNRLIDNTKANETVGVFYFAFGDEPRKGDKLYLGFDAKHEFPKEEIKLIVNIFDADLSPIAGGESADSRPELVPSAELEWHYWSSYGRWNQLQVNDDTVALTRNGSLRFKGPEDIASANIEEVRPVSDKALRWIRASVKTPGYELPPRLDTIVLNTVSATHGKTIWDERSSSNGLPFQKIKLRNKPVLHRTVELKIFEEDKSWHDWKEADDFDASGPEDRYFTVNSQDGLIKFGDGIHGRIPPTDSSNIQVVKYHAGDQKITLDEHSSGDGSPLQKIKLKNKPVSHKTVELRVFEEDKKWHVWIEVDDFSASGPKDRHFTVDSQNGLIEFGDGTHGRKPPVVKADGNNIQVVKYRTGGGEKGNVRADMIQEILDPRFKDKVKLNNRRLAVGGAEPEPLNKSKSRARRILKEVSRGITTTDFETLTLNTPGIRITRVKVLTGYHEKYPTIQIPGAVTVVVVPEILPGDTESLPEPSDGLLQNVRKHLNSKTLVSTNLRVIGPEFIEVKVAAKIRIDPWMYADTVREQVLEALRKFLNPLTGGHDSKGWTFGRTVYRSEIFQVIEGIEGVTCVDKVTLIGKSCDSSQKDRITLRKIGLVYSGEHQITIC